MDKEVDILNIPAFKRKKSIDAKAKKTDVLIKKSKSTQKSNTLTEHHIEMMTASPLIDTYDKPSNFKAAEPHNKRVKIMKICGRIEGYYESINVVVISVTSAFRRDDKLIYETSEGLFEEQAISIQKDNKAVTLARAGDEIGIKVSLAPKMGGIVYKIID